MELWFEENEGEKTCEPVIERFARDTDTYPN